MNRFLPSPEHIAEQAEQIRSAHCEQHVFHAHPAELLRKREPLHIPSPPTQQDCAAQVDAAMRIMVDARLTGDIVWFPGGWAVTHRESQMRIFDARQGEASIISNAAAYSLLQRILAWSKAYQMAEGGEA